MTLQQHLMIDLETTALTPDAGIVQIGAVVFDLESVNSMYSDKVSMASCESRGLKVDKDTMHWWSKQNPDLRTKVFSGTKDIAEALGDFLAQYVEPRELYIWSNGADFDLPILKNAFEICGFRYPFDFRKHRCYRTLKALVPNSVAEQVAPNTQKHDALSDAVYQALVAQSCMRYLNASSLSSLS